MKLLATLILPFALAAQAHAAPRAQDDLFLAVNGQWLQHTTIAADQASAFGTDLPGIVDQRVRDLVQQMAASRQPAGSIAHQVATYYRAFTDTAEIDRRGLAPIQPLLAEIDAIASATELAQWQGRAQGRLTTPVWLWGGFADFKQPGVSRAMAWQGGLGLPDRDFYLKQDDARYAQAMAAYRAYLTELAALSGAANPAAMAESVLALEQRIAAAHVPLAEARDPGKMYAPMSAQELASHAPGFDWSAFLQAAGIAPDTRVTVTQAPAAQAIARLYSDVPLRTWKDYFALRSLDEAAPVLPRAFRAAHFAFHAKALAGATEPRPRWQAGIAELNDVLGEGIGQLYVERYVPASHKARVLQMTSNILAAYRDAITANTWMTPSTRAAALDKLAKYKVKAGYPDHWRDYAGMSVVDGDALGNRHRARRYEWERKAAMHDKPVDASAWMMTPQTVNAYYDPALNEIVLPAGILQAPLFDMAADDAANYGALGALIAHEISHGFDNLGNQFDGDGVLRNWWSDADRSAFNAIGARLAQQYDHYEPLPGKHVNGTLTLPENLADLGGLQIAYQAYRKTLGGRAAPKVKGRSGEQRFFISYALSLRAKVRDQHQLTLLASDPHAPHAYRVNGAAINVDGFHDAFGTRPGDAMYKARGDRIRVW